MKRIKKSTKYTLLTFTLSTFKNEKMKKERIIRLIFKKNKFKLTYNAFYEYTTV